MKKLKILITAGPVHSHIDPLMILTLRFQGIEILTLALALSKICDVTLIANKETLEVLSTLKKRHRIKTIVHEGFEDYAAKVVDLAPSQDAVLLGAKVVDLLPVTTLKENFPSYKYRPGVIFPIDFHIAPSVSKKVRQSAPNVFLIGYHLSFDLLLSEQMEKAMGMLAEGDVNAVIVNDPTNFEIAHVATKEKTFQLVPEEILSLIQENK